MKDEVKRIIKLVQDGKLSAEDAAELIAAFQEGEADGKPEEHASQEAQAAAEEAKADEAQSEEAKAEGEKPAEDPFSKLIGGIESIAKDVSRNVNWREIASEVKRGVNKAVDLAKQAAEEAGKGKGGWSFMGPQVTKKVDLNLAIPEGKILRLDGVAGSFTVQGGAENPQILVEARFRAFSEEEARLIAERYSPMLEESDTHVTLRHNETDHLQAQVTAFIPKGVAVEIKSTAGDVKVSETHAPVRVSSNSGDVSISQAKGAVDVHLNSGEISISDSEPSLLTAESQSGDLHLRDITGPANLRTSSGDVVLKNWEGKTLSVEAASGDISVSLQKPVAGTMSIRTVSGDIHIVVPESSDARVNLSTLRGHATCDLTLTDEQKESTKVTGILGAGKGAIDASAVNGDVRLAGLPVEADPAE